MNILLIRWNGIGHEDIEDAFVSLGHCVTKYSFSNDVDKEKEIKDEIEEAIKKESFNLVFSFNFYPVISEVCYKTDIPYISWTYDSPYVRLYHRSIAYPTNYAFVFDSAVFEEFYRGGLNNVYYLPMAANTSRLKKMTDFNSFSKTSLFNSKSISFVGSLYSEKHNFYERMNNFSDYSRGFLEGVIDAQRKIYGENFVQRILKDNPEVLKDMKNTCDFGHDPEGIETDEFLYSQYVINIKITAVERKELLEAVGEKFGLDLYTSDKSVALKGCVNHGPVDYYDWAPYVFKNSKINLNISLRSIINGIPLRCFEIMGSEGFLLTNYQQDFMNHFVPDEDFVYFDSEKDMLDKIEYYLNNDAERKEIAHNGFKKIEAEHTYIHRAKEMLSYIE